MNCTLSRTALRNAKHMNIRHVATKVEDVRTHTGQKWDSHDYRMARFMHAPKVVNPNWPIKLITEIPPKQITGRVAWCDGGSSTEGHPRIFINLDKPGEHYCMYCSQAFIKVDGS